MEIPSTEVDICNLALDRLGQESISSIEAPTTKTEAICSRHYPTTIREMLRRYVFNFSKKYAVLTADATKTPAHGYSTAYKLPNDHVRLLAIGDVAINADTPSSLYDLSEGYIFTDYGDSTGLKIQYVYADPPISIWDSLFTRLATLHLAANMAFKFSLKNSLIKEIRDDASDVALSAAAICGQEKPPRRVERSRARDARRTGGWSRDPRYY